MQTQIEALQRIVRVKIRNRRRARAYRQPERVRPRATPHRVARPKNEQIEPRAAIEAVRTVAAIEHVVARIARQRIRTPAARQRVAALSPRHAVSTGPTNHDVALQPALHPAIRPARQHNPLTLEVAQRHKTGAFEDDVACHADSRDIECHGRRTMGDRQHTTRLGNGSCPDGYGMRSGTDEFQPFDRRHPSHATAVERRTDRCDLQRIDTTAASDAVCGYRLIDTAADHIAGCRARQIIRR